MNTMKTSKTFNAWLHELTVAGYDNEVVIPAKLLKVVENLFDLGHSAKSAIAYLLTYRKDDLIPMRG